MKKVLFLTVMPLILASTFISCDMNDYDAGEGYYTSQDDFIGSYSYSWDFDTSTSFISYEPLYQFNTYSENGHFTIEKTNKPNQVVMKFSNGTSKEFTVSGNSISNRDVDFFYAPYSELLLGNHSSFDGKESSNGKINRDILIILSDIEGTHRITGATYLVGNFTGNSKIIAIKE